MSDKEIIRVSMQFTKGLLGKHQTSSMCFAVSAPLQRFLSVCGVETELIEGEIETDKELWNHYWLKLKDGRILDTTASQFNKPNNTKMPDIFLGEKPEWYKENEKYKLKEYLRNLHVISAADVYSEIVNNRKEIQNEIKKYIVYDQ